MANFLKESSILRPFMDENDYLSMLDLFNRCQKFDQIDKVFTASNIKQELQRLPGFDITQQMFFVQVQNEQNLIGSIGFNWRQDVEDNLIYEFHHWMVDPNWRGVGIEKTLLQKAEAWLVECSKSQKQPGKKWLQTRIKNTFSSQINLLETNDYTIHRQTIKMSRPTSLELSDATFPEGLIIRKPEPNEYRKILEANDEVSRDLWGYSPKTEEQFQKWEQDRLFQPEYWKVAWDNDHVAGMVLGYIDEEENSAFKRKVGYTEEIAVCQPWRRKGLARWLLSESIKMFRDMGMEETTLSVDSLNQSGAYQFYEKMGYSPISEYRYYRKQLPT
jgi:mycothiol synthase